MYMWVCLNNIYLANGRFYIRHVPDEIRKELVEFILTRLQLI